MNDTHKLPGNYPHAIVRKRVVLSLIWLVPVIAAIVAGILIFQNWQKFGPVITIRFDNANGLDPNQTIVRYRGVRVGNVRSIELTKDMQGVEVRARLSRFAAGLAHDGSLFWVVRPEVGAAGIRALETIVSGPYIEAMPGSSPGKTQDHFVGLNEAPIIKEGVGTEYVLRAPLIRSLGPNSPVYFRGVQAGKVLYLELSRDSTVVNAHILIKPSFVPLIRANTVWWNAGGVDLSWHLLSGLSMTAENLKAVITGGIAFATPNEPGEQAPPGMAFELYEKPDVKWFDWSPRISITNATVSEPANPAAVDLENANQTQNQVQKQQ